MIARIVSKSKVTSIQARYHILGSFVITATMYIATSAWLAKSSLVKMALKILDAVCRMIAMISKGYYINLADHQSTRLPFYSLRLTHFS